MTGDVSDEGGPPILTGRSPFDRIIVFYVCMLYVVTYVCISFSLGGWGSFVKVRSTVVGNICTNYCGIGTRTLKIPNG